MYEVNVNNKKYIISFENNRLFKINDKKYEMDIVSVSKNEYHLIVNKKSYNIQIKQTGTQKSYLLYINGLLYQTVASDQYDILLKDLGMDNLSSKVLTDLKAPMPGMVLELMVSEKSKVNAGDPLMILEAMKMENVIKSPADAIIKKILISKGMAVEKNEVLIEFGND